MEQVIVYLSVLSLALAAWVGLFGVGNKSQSGWPERCDSDVGRCLSFKMESVSASAERLQLSKVD